LKELSSEQFDELLNKFDTMSPQAKICFLEITAEKQESKLRELLLRSLKSGDISERLTAIRSLGKLGDVSMIPILISSLQDTALKNAAVEALRHYPVSEVAKPLLDALQKPELRASAIDVIVAMKYYDAIDTLITLAEQEDDSAITGLGRLCDPDDSDLPRLLNLYFKSRTGAHREKVERAIVVVCEKIPQAEERANKILDLLAKRNDGLSNDVLAATFPLLGKIGNQRVAAILLPLLEDKNSELQQAAVRAFCNWPNADYADELWKIAAQSKSIAYRQWALRAYIRVITLKSDRPESETLEMLKKAMELAATDSDRQWALSRASAIRTMDSARWAASYLDNSALSQTACVVLTELAHHRFLREPNKAAFETILLKVEKIAKDKSVAERAKKARLGM